MHVNHTASTLLLLPPKPIQRDQPEPRDQRRSARSLQHPMANLPKLDQSILGANPNQTTPLDFSAHFPPN
jgi:hypothetical protein